jgi:hypothetical protein
MRPASLAAKWERIFTTKITKFGDWVIETLRHHGEIVFTANSEEAYLEGI